MLIVGAWSHTASAGQVSGELKKWHKVTVTFDGPQTSEMADPNPFLDYRLNVTFTHQGSGESKVVPGYYAADGDAANTGADSGNKWRVHFAPDAVGDWKYSVSFRKGPNVAVTEGNDAGQSAGFMDGQAGSFRVGPTDKTGRDFRGKGLLQYVGKHHLRFAETGEFFLKCGADAPENFLAYADFDGDFKTDGEKDNFIKDWAPHIKDFKPGDPTWQGGKGKGIIGAVNYLASKGMNVFSFLTMNIEGDDRNVFPYTTYDERVRLDVSRLAQWEIVFEHGTRLGMYLHFKTMETENELLLDNGDLGPQRKLYYRELIARFSHNLALNWNLGEEINDATTEQKAAWANYFWTQDPYQHHIVIHNMGEPHYDLLGDASKLTGFSLQTNKPDFSQVHRRTRDYIDRSVAAGKPWVVACDEPGDASHGLITDAEDPTRDNARKNALWGNIMAGGAGVEWYFGYKHPHSDLTCQDWRTREKVWDQCRYALEFFKKHEIPFWEMKCEDEMTENTEDYVLCKPGRIYLVYLKHGGKVELSAASGNYNYGWFNPRTGDGLDGLLHTGSAKAGRKTEVTAPDNNDWLLVIKGSGRLQLASEQPPAPEVAPTAEGTIVLKAVRDFRIVTAEGFVDAYKDDGHDALAIDPGKYKDKFAAAEAKFSGQTGAYDITLTTMAETDGESTYKLLIGRKPVGQFTNPRTSVDYKPTPKTWKNVSVAKGATIRAEFNTATNSNQTSGRIPYARGRWIALTLTPTGAKKAQTAAGDEISSGSIEARIFEETGGLVAVEAEHFAVQTETQMRKWYVTTAAQTPDVSPDGDESHADSASGGGYIEILPDTRRNHSMKLINGENFSNQPGKLAVLVYPVRFKTPGRYYVWVRAYSTGSEDNGLHVGLDGTWPESGQRLQWCEGKESWRWESKQRTEAEHCGEPYKIYLDIDSVGLHTIEFSMREDGFEFDKWLMTKDRGFTRPEGPGPS
ncbi:MAG: DUF5060 domain-containing protein [Phycisphaerae bacterium]|nr:DUF5060 domain-containing protein [Phycisphaerae bacterium]